MSHNIIDAGLVHKNSLVIMVDYSNWLYRAYFSGLKDVEIKPWMPFLRALDMLRTCVRISRDAYQKPVTFFFAGDSIRQKLAKMKTDENYKADRPSLTDLRFYVFRHIMNLIVKGLGCDIIYSEGYEADELIASAVKRITTICSCGGDCGKECVCKKKPHTDIVIFSADKDLEICLDYKFVEVYKGYGKFYTRSDYIADYGFLPSSHLTYKALVGDKSDNISGVPSWGDSKAKEHIIKSDWQELLEKDSEKWRIFISNVHVLGMDWDIPLDNPYGDKMVFGVDSEELMRKIQNEYKQPEAIEEIIFEMKRLIEEVK